MTDHRNTSSGNCQDARGTVCIDTQRVLDSCRDRDCFENTRVYLTACGEEILANATNVRARSATILWAYVGVNEVPFNCGFYQVSIRYYIVVDLEACLGIGRSQSFKGLAVLEKDVVLYGGEGNVTTFSSDPENGYCSINENNRGTNAPVAIVETVEPMILGLKVKERECCNGCGCVTDCTPELPACVCGCLGADICTSDNAPKLYVSFGVFSVIRIVRPAQLLIEGSDYSVPDKECVAATNDENPCAVFQNMPFPTARFRTAVTGTVNNNEGQRGRGCGCR